MLMQKVTKEVMELVKNGHYKMYTNSSFDKKADWKSTEYLQHLFGVRETKVFTELQHKLASKMKGGKTLFDIWMMEEAFLVQDCAMAYVERMVLNQFLERIDAADDDLKPTLQKVCNLFAAACIQRDLAWYVCNDIVTKEQGLALEGDVAALCGDSKDGLGLDILKLIESFDIPDYVVSAPIAADWVAFNEKDNVGEVI